MSLLRPTLYRLFTRNLVTYRSIFSWPFYRRIRINLLLLPHPHVLCSWHLTFMCTCVEHRKRNSHLHCLTGHLCTWTTGEVQGLPPFTGGGLVHDRNRFLCVRPQRRHWDHEDHSDKPPSTTKKQFYVSVSENCSVMSDFFFFFTLIEGTWLNFLRYKLIVKGEGAF